MDSYIQVFWSLVTALIAAFVGSQLALKGFYREKWWEAKMASYAKIIEALHHMKYDLEISLRAEEEGRDTDTDYFKSSDNRNKKAWVEMRKAVDVGDFLLSNDAMKIIRTFFKETDALDGAEVSYYEHLDHLLAAVNKCLPAIKEAGRLDLKLPAIEVASST